MEKLITEIVTWLKEQLKVNNRNGVVLGVSGGVDSSVLFMLLAKGNIDFIPIQIDEGISQKETEKISLDFLNSNFPDKIININSDFIIEAFRATLRNSGIDNNTISFLTTNIRARIRENIFYCYSKINNYLVLGSVNKLEYNLGYFVKNSSIGDLMPFADIDKTTIREMAIYLGLPQEIAYAKASGCNGKEYAEEEWQLTEKEVEILIKGHEIQSRNNEKLFRQYNSENEHKRLYPLIFKLDSTYICENKLLELINKIYERIDATEDNTWESVFNDTLADIIELGNQFNEKYQSKIRWLNLWGYNGQNIWYSQKDETGRFNSFNQNIDDLNDHLKFYYNKIVEYNISILSSRNLFKEKPIDNEVFRLSNNSNLQASIYTYLVFEREIFNLIFSKEENELAEYYNHSLNYFKVNTNDRLVKTKTKIKDLLNIDSNDERIAKFLNWILWVHKLNQDIWTDSFYLDSTLFDKRWENDKNLKEQVSQGLLFANIGFNAIDKENVQIEWFVYQFKNILNKLRFRRERIEYEKIIRSSQIKSAIAAIMARNMSHNIGSHVITNTKAHIEQLAYTHQNIQPDLLGLSKLLHYIQERQDFISVLAAGEQYAKGPVNLKNHIFDYMAYDGPSARHNSAIITNFFLDNIVKSEDFTRNFTGGNLKRIELRIKDKGHELYSLKSDKEEAQSLSKINFSIPYGINGRQAFLSIIENTIRNSAKHLKKFIPDNRLLITIEIEKETDKAYIISIYDNKGHFNEVIENINGEEVLLIPVDEKTIDKKGEVLKKFKIRPGALKIYNDDGTINHEFKGIKEMLICIGWMKGVSDYSILEEDIYEKLGICFKEVPNGDSHSFAINFQIDKFLPVFTLFSDETNGQSTEENSSRLKRKSIVEAANVIYSDIKDNKESDPDKLKKAYEHLSSFVKSLPAAEIYLIDPSIDDSGHTRLHTVLQYYLSRVILNRNSQHSRDEESTYYNESFKTNILPYYQNRNAEKNLNLEDAFDFPLVIVDQSTVSMRGEIGGSKCLYSLKNDDLKSGTYESHKTTIQSVRLNGLKDELKKRLEESEIKYREQDLQYFFDGLSQNTNVKGSKEQNSDLLNLIVEKIKSQGYDAAKKPGFILFKNHYEVLDKNKSFIGLNENSNCLFLEGISGGNYTHTLIRNTDFTRKHFIKIIESSLTRISIIDERLFLKFRDPIEETNGKQVKNDFLKMLKGSYLLDTVKEILKGLMDKWQKGKNENESFNTIESDVFSERLADAIIEWGRKNSRALYNSNRKIIGSHWRKYIEPIVSKFNPDCLTENDAKAVIDYAFTIVVSEDEPVKPKNLGTYYAGKNVFIYTIHEPEKVSLDNDFNIPSVTNSNAPWKEVLDSSHFISIHYSLIEKLSELLKEQGQHDDNNLVKTDSTEKLKILFEGYQGKLCIHSGRGELYKFEKDSVAFLPLSSIEWALENSKFMLTELFYNLKYYPNGRTTESK